MSIEITTLTKDLANHYKNEIIELYNQTMGSFKAEYTQEMVLKDLPMKWELSLIGIHNDNPVGFILISVYNDRVIAHIHQISISTGCQRKGLGRNIINTLIKRCKSNSIKSITLECNLNNRSAIKFYERFGFKQMNSDMIQEYLHNKNKTSKRKQFYPLSDEGNIVVMYYTI